MQVDWVQVANLLVTVTIPIGAAVWRFYTKTQTSLAELKIELARTQNDVLRLNESHEIVSELRTRIAVLEYAYGTNKKGTQA